MSQQRRVFVIGVGMTKFEKPGKRDWDYPDMAKEAITKALADAKLQYSDVQQAVVGYVYGDSCAGQRAVYEAGITGIPIYNVNNNCSTGSTALYMGKQLIAGGIASCVLAVGFEKMERGSLGAKFTDRTNPLEKHMTTMINLRGMANAPGAPQMFGNAGREHMEKYGTTKQQFAKIAQKNHKHSVNNPYSQFMDEYSLSQVLQSPVVYEPLTKLQCCPTSDGSAAVLLADEQFVVQHNLQSQAVEIVGQSMTTDTPSSFTDSCIRMVGFDMSKKAAEEVYQQTGLSPRDVQVVELHDCFSCNELLTYEALGLCDIGKGGQLIDSGDVTYGGKWVVNPSGGLISKGHPLGATGLAQCSELCWQLRQMAGKRQVPNAKVALQHNIGLGGAAVVTMYRLGFPDKFQPYPANLPNPAVSANTLSSLVNTSIPAAVPQGPSSSQAPTGPSGFKADAVFDSLMKLIKANPSLVQSVAGIYQFEISSGNQSKSWTVDLKNGAGSVVVGKAANADCTIATTDDDFVALMSGKASPQDLFMKGKIKVRGNMGIAMKLSKLQAPKSNL